MRTQAQMTLLSYLAYSDCWLTDPAELESKLFDLLGTVAKDLEFSRVCWGPVACRTSGELFTDSLVYAVQHEKGDEYTIVIRGTNPCSLSSWLFQDLSVSGLTPWTRQSPHSAEKSAYISKATDRSMAIHTSLADASGTVLAWLAGLLGTGKKIRVNVTGHSLGGLMSSAFALYLREELTALGLNKYVDWSVYSFAGPSAGNAAFVDALRRAFGRNLNVYDNPLDVATLVWTEAGMKSLSALYKPKNITPSSLEQKAIDLLTSEVRALGYDRPERTVEIKSAPVPVPFDDYLLEALYQHVVPYPVKAFEEAPFKVIELIGILVMDLFSSGQLSDFHGQPVSLNAADHGSMRAVLSGGLGRDKAAK